MHKLQACVNVRTDATIDGVANAIPKQLTPPFVAVANTVKFVALHTNTGTPPDGRRFLQRTTATAAAAETFFEPLL